MSQVPSSTPFVRSARHLLWWLVGSIMLLASLFAGPRVWAQDILCAGNSSIPIAPLVIYAVQGVGATYDVSLCTNPTATVTVTPVLSPTGHIVVTPAVLTFQTSVTQTVAVSLANEVALTEVFTVAIRHNVASADPNYNWGTTNTPTVLVIYDGPLAVNDAAATAQGAPVAINILQNDHDRSGTGIVVESVGPSAQGQTTLQGNTVTFTPTATFTGTATFVYMMRDGRGNRDEGEVFVKVNPNDSNTDVPIIEEVDPTVDNTLTFTPTEDAPAVITVDLPPGFFDGELGPRDVLYIALTPIITPSNTVPPSGAYFMNLFYFLGIYLNGQLLDIEQLAEPITVTIVYAETPVNALTEQASGASPPALYYLKDGAWTQEGLEVLENNVQLQRLVIRTQVINREFALVNATVLRLPIIARQ